MIPVLTVRGETIAKAWQAALLALYEHGITIETSYDYEPNTGIKFPPSKDCMMTMIVEQPLAEPRLHTCFMGDPTSLGDYYAEVVDGVRDDWVRTTPGGTEWIYTYSGRLRSYGNRMNFATPDSVSCEKGSWTTLAYTTPISSRLPGRDGQNRSLIYQPIAPFDQIEYIAQALAKAPFTRRAIATTRFPSADSLTAEPPCLGEIWCRGYYEESLQPTPEAPGKILKIDMHTKWRSRDGWGAALFNMFAITELQRAICDRVQEIMNEQHNHDEELKNGECPACGGSFDSLWSDSTRSAAALICHKCGLKPYWVEPGSYVDSSDSFHVYGNCMKELEGFVKQVKERDESRLFWSLEEPENAMLLRQGRERAIDGAKKKAEAKR